MNARKQACRCPHKPNNTHMHHAQSSNSILGSKQLLCMPKHPASTLTKQLLQKILHSSDSAPCQLCFFTPGTKIKTQRDLRRMFKTTLFHVHSKLEHPQPFAYRMFLPRTQIQNRLSKKHSNPDLHKTFNKNTDYTYACYTLGCKVSSLCHWCLRYNTVTAQASPNDSTPRTVPLFAL